MESLPLRRTRQEAQSQAFPSPMRSGATEACAVSRQGGASLAPDATGRLASRAPGKKGVLRVCRQPAVLLFRDFSVQGLLGEGRFGSVWRCSHRATGEEFACKQIEKSEEGARALARELECLTHVQGHDGVLSLKGVFESERFVYLLTDLCVGGDLFDEIRNHGAIHEGYARDLFCQLVAAVHHCHTRGVMHRDIKPENVLLTVCPATGQKQVKLADFGLSTRLAKGEKTIGWVGSEPYEAPEVLANRPYGFLADVYSLGVVLFGMFSGTWPSFTEDKEFDAEGDFSWPGWQAISDPAKELIIRMLCKDPTKRPGLDTILEDEWMFVDFEDWSSESMAEDTEEADFPRAPVESRAQDVPVHCVAGQIKEMGSVSKSSSAARPLSLSTLIASLEPLRIALDSKPADSTSPGQQASAQTSSKAAGSVWEEASDLQMLLSKRRTSLVSPEGSATDISWAGSGLSSPSTASDCVDSPTEWRSRRSALSRTEL